MAKKKLNKNFAVAAVITLAVLGGGGGIAYKVFTQSYRPQQRKAAGRELMLKGDYKEAAKQFSMVATRLPTDVEFMRWFLETLNRQTSFNEDSWMQVSRQLDTILATAPRDLPTLLERLKFDLGFFDRAGGADRASPDVLARLRQVSEKILDAEPTNSLGLRGLALAEAIPAFQQNSVMTSGDVEVIQGKLKDILDKAPNEPNVSIYYAMVTLRLRMALISERQINDGAASNPRIVAMFEDLDARSKALAVVGADEKQPAELRGNAYRAASVLDLMILQNGLTADKTVQKTVIDRYLAEVGAACDVMPATAEEYLQVRAEWASKLADMGRADEAEEIYKKTVDALPLQWKPRLLLAEFYGDRARPDDAIQVLSADLKPNFELTGWTGIDFIGDARIVPLRRSFLRLQSLVRLAPEQRDAQIAAAQNDFDTAMANGKISEGSPLVLQTKAGLMEIKGDRTGAIQTLTRALEAIAVDDQRSDKLRMRIMQQLVSLNLSINQPGAASSMLERILAASGNRPSQDALQAYIQLIDMYNRNGEKDEARSNLDKAKLKFPNNPALVALEIKMMEDPAQKKAALAKLPEDSLQAQLFKIKFAGELEDDATVRRIAKELLDKTPGAPEVSLLYGDYLRRHDKKDEAIAVLSAAKEKSPDDKSIDFLLRSVKGESPEEMLPGVLSPYKLAMFEAERARSKGDFDTYRDKLVVAESQEKENDGVASERLFMFYLANNDTASAEKSYAKLQAIGRDPSLLKAMSIRILLVKGQVEEASTQVDALTSERPQFSAGWVLKGLIQQARGQYAQSINSYETALSNQPENIEALRGAIESADRAGRKDVLKRCIDAGLRIDKNDEYFVDWSLRYELAFGDPTKTIEPRLKMRDAKPDNPATWLALAQSYQASSAAKEVAGDRVAAADYRGKAQETVRAAMAKFPDIAGFTLESANAMAASGDVDGASALVQAMSQNPKFADDAGVQILRADFFVKAGKVDLARDVLEQAVKSPKANDTARIRLASIYADQGKTDEALAVMKDATDTPQARELRMNILMTAKRYDEANALVNDALVKEKSVSNLLMAALVRAQQQKLDEAIKLTDDAVAMDPENPIARFTRARMMLGQRPVRNNDVIADLRVVARNQPANVEGRMMLVDRLQAIGKNAEALSELEAVDREYPGNLTAVTRLVQLYAAETPMRMIQIDRVLAEAKKQGLEGNTQLLSLEAGVASQAGDMKRAMEAASKAVQSNPNDVDLVRSLLGYLIRAGANQDVITYVDKVQANNNTLYWTYLIRGVAYHRLRDEAKAKPEFDRAMSIAQSLKESSGPVNEIANNYAMEYGADVAAEWVRAKLPDSIETQTLAMRLLMSGGKTDQAIKQGEELLKRIDDLQTPAKLQLLSSLGTAYLSIAPARPSDARQMFQKMTELEPDNMMTLNNLAYAMSLEGSGSSIQEALAIAKKANDLSVSNAVPNAYIMDTYGWTLIQANQIDDGLEVLRQALEVERIPDVLYHMGEAYLRKPDKVSAQQYLQSATEALAIQKAKGQVVDSTLEGRIAAAVQKAQELADPQ